MKKIFYITSLVMTALNGKAQVKELNTIKLINFKAYERNDKLFIDWQPEMTLATDYFEVQCSEDGKNFKTIALVLGPDPSQQENRYQYKAKLNGTENSKTYYRLRHIDSNGHEQMTEIIQLIK